MAGRKGMKWRRPGISSPTLIEAFRAKVDAEKIREQLEKHVLGQIEMTSTQVTAALGLLRKCVPDLSQVDVAATVEHNYVARTPEVSQNVEQWQEQHRPTVQ